MTILERNVKFLGVYVALSVSDYAHFFNYLFLYLDKSV